MKSEKKEGDRRDQKFTNPTNGLKSCRKHCFLQCMEGKILPRS